MRSYLAPLALALVLAASPAHARPHHQRHHHRAVNINEPGQPSASAGIQWCGCWLRLRFGIAEAGLNLARAWASIGEAVRGPAAGVVAVWPHHVGLITENLGGGLIRLLSGNDGNAVRERVRSTRGIIAYRKV
ncbi:MULTISPECIES: hypothetical protein [unclassified Bradyrhizobium]|uniref:hypothetical protein n=1 Tax=unclassified Bradyrhizobium TaxID=2631580 RepID=UPI0028E461D5|nr:MULTISPECIES: hypothetical protein [unclassified Bradyrhizobium]